MFNTQYFLDNKNIFDVAVKDGIEGNTLILTKLTRADGGAYLCIAQNGVPSPVSKRIMVHVHCKKETSIQNYIIKIFFQFIQASMQVKIF